LEPTSKVDTNITSCLTIEILKKKSMGLWIDFVLKIGRLREVDLSTIGWIVEFTGDETT
jgi:hypothetical protein